MDAVEGAAPAPAGSSEMPAINTATADLGSPAPEADKAEAEPEWDEVWFPGGRRPDNPRHEKRQRFSRPPTGGTPPGAEAAPVEGAAERPKNFRRPDRDKAANAAPGGKPQRRFEGGEGKGGKPKFGGKREREDWKEHRSREKREVALDPNSPWAALAALRNPKSE
jgi:ATP-dependent RNA helicase SUPV3L1/SUV3